MPDFQCKACNSKISEKFLRLHLQRSLNPRCQLYLKELDRDLPSDDDSVSEAPVVDFVGDFFGDYNEMEEQDVVMEDESGSKGEHDL